MPRTREEILQDIADLIGDDKAEAQGFADELHRSVHPVAQSLYDRANKAAKERAGAELTKAREAQKTAEDALAERDQEVADLKAKVPDAQKIEQQATEKWSKKVEAARAEALKARAERDSERVAAAKGRLAAELKTLGIDDDYADEVLTSRFGDRLITTEDGTLQVLQVGETTPIVPQDGKLDSAIKLLALEVKKTVKPEWIRNNADSGAGVGGAGRRVPVAAGRPNGNERITAGLSPM